MDYRAETELGSLAKSLLEDLERVRPGFPEGATQEEVQKAVALRARVRLQELHSEIAEVSPSEGSSQSAQLAIYRREVEEILIPRYATLATAQNQIERQKHPPLTGADLWNRVAWLTIFAMIGAFVVWAPFIPLWDKWIPFVMGALAAVFAPALPDLHKALMRRRHEVHLLTLLIDIDQDGKALPSEPLQKGLLEAPSQSKEP